MENLKMKMMQHYFDQTTKVSMVASTLLTVLVNISGTDLLKTIILAAVGAVVSFAVSQVLKAIVKYFKR